MQRFILEKGESPQRSTILSNATAFLSRLPASRSWVLEIRPYSKPRTLKQNAALWGCAYPPLMEYMGEEGTEARERLHETICCSFFGSVTNALGIRKPIRTTTRNERGERDPIDRATASMIYSFVQRLGDEHGVFIPDPDPMYGVNVDPRHRDSAEVNRALERSFSPHTT